MSLNVTVVDHPLLAAKLACIQDRTTDSATMRRLVAQASQIITTMATTTIDTKQNIALVPLMRSGLAMVDAVLDILVPGNSVIVHHLGLFRQKKTLEAVEYYNNIPTAKKVQLFLPDFWLLASILLTGEQPVEHAIIVDPLLATGTTSVAAIDTLK